MSSPMSISGLDSRSWLGCNVGSSQRYWMVRFWAGPHTTGRSQVQRCGPSLATSTVTSMTFEETRTSTGKEFHCYPYAIRNQALMGWFSWGQDACLSREARLILQLVRFTRQHTDRIADIGWKSPCPVSSVAAVTPSCPHPSSHMTSHMTAHVSHTAQAPFTSCRGSLSCTWSSHTRFRFRMFFHFIARIPTALRNRYHTPTRRRSFLSKRTCY